MDADEIERAKSFSVVASFSKSSHVKNNDGEDKKDISANVKISHSISEDKKGGVIGGIIYNVLHFIGIA